MHMPRKQLIVLFCAVLLGLWLTACTTPPSEPEETATEEAPQVEVEPQAESESEIPETQEEETAESASETEVAKEIEPKPCDRDSIVGRYERTPVSFDPNNPDAEYVWAKQIYNRLVRFKFDSLSELEGELAESWEWSDDGLTLTLHLRDDVMWQKGYGKFTAEDVNFTFDRIMAEDSTNNKKNTFREAIDSTEIVDDYTFVVNFKRPSPAFMGAHLTGRESFIVNQQAIEDAGDDYWRSPVGTGAYIVENYVHGESYDLVAFDDYFRGHACIKNVEVRIIPDETVAGLGLRNGDIDVTYLRTADVYNQLRDDPAVSIVKTPVSGWRGGFFNTETPPFDDARIRKAIQMMIDTELIANEVMEGTGSPITHYTVINPGVFGHNPNVPSYAYNPERARELLAEAGYPDGNFDFTIIFNPGDRPVMVVLERMLSEFGINVILEEVTEAQMSTRTESGDFDFAQGSPYRAEPDQFMVYFEAENAPKPNFGRYSNPRVDELITQQRFEPDREKRKEILWEIQEIIADDAPYLMWYIPNLVTVTNSNLHGDIPNHDFWNFLIELMWWEE
jgi:peptide/nickel transport system substrate-binding protein